MNDSGHKRLLYYSPSTTGGIADYARLQARALANLGVPILLLTSPSWRVDSSDNYAVDSTLFEPTLDTKENRAMRRFQTALSILRNARSLDKVVRRTGAREVLMGSYAEYLAPVWSVWMRRMRTNGVRFSAIVHDPVRDYVVGPLWWHQWSVRSGYSFLSNAFVHEMCNLEVGTTTSEFKVIQIPHGPYTFPPHRGSKKEARFRLNLPESATIVLAFGNIRDGKNLDLLIESIRQNEQLILLVAGKVQSKGQRPVEYYQDFARRVGVSKRCYWINRHIEEREVGELFTAADLVALGYSATFRSASGVLNLAVNFKKPCIASSGPGNLKTMVQRYKLGVWVDPDSVEALRAGLAQFESAPPTPLWDEYTQDNSWDRNAAIVASQLSLITGAPNTVPSPVRA
jgi:glycosyltransferase involved in cell wall biosynthesis